MGRYIDHILNRSFAVDDDSANPSEITKADAEKVLAGAIQRSRIYSLKEVNVEEVISSRIAQNASIDPLPHKTFILKKPSKNNPRAYKPLHLLPESPEFLRFALKSKLVYWGYYKEAKPFDKYYCIGIEYASPVNLELDLLDPKGNQVDKEYIRGDIFGASDSGYFLIESPMDGTYKLIVKPRKEQTEIIRTHNISYSNGNFVFDA